MSKWKEVSLGDVCDLLDCLHKTPEYSSEGFPMVRVTDVKNGYLDLSNCLRVTKEVFNNFCKGYSPKYGDIVFTRVGSYGLSAFVKNNEEFCLGQNTVFIISKRVYHKFVYYYLISSDARHQIDGLVGGSTQPTISMADIRKINLPFPPLPEQKAIASVLSSLDDKIDLLHRQNKTLEAIAETLFRQWFIEEADDSWEEKPLSYFGEIVCGKTPSKKNPDYFNGDIPFIKIPDMHGNTFIMKTADSLTDEGKASQLNKTLPPKSICVSCIATVGLVSMNVIESQTNQQINSIIPNKEYYTYFIYLYMKSIYDLLHSMASGGTATLNLNTGNFSKINITYLSDHQLIDFYKITKPSFDRILSNFKQITTLQQMRDTLLPKLMSGEVRIKC